MSHYPKIFFNSKVTEISEKSNSSFRKFKKIMTYVIFKITYVDYDGIHFSQVFGTFIILQHTDISSLLKLRTSLSFAIRIISLPNNLYGTSLSNSSTVELPIHESLIQFRHWSFFRGISFLHMKFLLLPSTLDKRRESPDFRTSRQSARNQGLGYIICDKL